MQKVPKNPINRKIVELIGDEYGALKQFAAKADINPGTLATAICRDNTPSLSTLIAISRAHNVSLDKLCEGYETGGWFGL